MIGGVGRGTSIVVVVVIDGRHICEMLAER